MMIYGGGLLLTGYRVHPSPAMEQVTNFLFLICAVSTKVLY